MDKKILILGFELRYFEPRVNETAIFLNSMEIYRG